MELVELCFPDEADAESRARAVAFCESIGKTAIEVPDEPGFVVNRLLFPYLFDAVRLLERTGMEPADVDACMRLGAAHRMGPLELLDMIGLDVADAIGEAIHADTRRSARLDAGTRQAADRRGQARPQERRRLLRLLRAIARQLEADRRAGRGRGIGPDATAVGLDDRPGDREPESAAAAVARAAGIGAMETIEYAIDLVGRDARTVVADREPARHR